MYILRNPAAYETYDLYVQADIAYWVGSVVYLAAALRDDGACAAAPPHSRVFVCHARVATGLCGRGSEGGGERGGWGGGGGDVWVAACL